MQKIIYLKMEPYLHQWFVHENDGKEPVSLRRGSPEINIFRAFIAKKPEGWSAEVNGEKADIVKASYGFMAVRCKAGENEIVFHYVTPGIRAGAVMTGVGAVALAEYIYLGKRSKNDPDDKKDNGKKKAKKKEA